MNQSMRDLHFHDKISFILDEETPLRAKQPKLSNARSQHVLNLSCLESENGSPEQSQKGRGMKRKQAITKMMKTQRAPPEPKLKKMPPKD